MDRKRFIQRTAVLGIATSIVPSWLASCVDSGSFIYVKSGIGVQLYSVRQLISQDIESVLRKISETGFAHVETFDWTTSRKHSPAKTVGWTVDRRILGHSIPDFKRMLQSYQLKTYSGHYYIPEVFYEQKWDIWKQAIEDAAALGQEYVIIPWIDVEKLKKLGGISYFSDIINQAAAHCHEMGVMCAYHNHAFEFEHTYEGKTWMAYLLDNTDPQRVHFQMDLYWIEAANVSIKDFLSKHQDRVYLWHIKDMNKTNPKLTETVGKGSIDYDNILVPLYASKLLYPVYEQEHGMIVKEEAFKALEQSYAYISRFIKKKV